MTPNRRSQRFNPKYEPVETVGLDRTAKSQTYFRSQAVLQPGRNARYGRKAAIQIGYFYALICDPRIKRS